MNQNRDKLMGQSLGKIEPKLLQGTYTFALATCFDFADIDLCDVVLDSRGIQLSSGPKPTDTVLFVSINEMGTLDCRSCKSSVLEDGFELLVTLVGNPRD